MNKKPILLQSGGSRVVQPITEEAPTKPETKKASKKRTTKGVKK